VHSVTLKHQRQGIAIARATGNTNAAAALFCGSVVKEFKSVLSKTTLTRQCGISGETVHPACAFIGRQTSYHKASIPSPPDFDHVRTDTLTSTGRGNSFYRVEEDKEALRTQLATATQYRFNSDRLWH
jgi:hypothetical protein